MKSFGRNTLRKVTARPRSSTGPPRFIVPMAGVAIPDLEASNRAAFREYQPDVYAGLEKISQTFSTVVMENGRPANIDLGTARLYPKDAAEWSGEQVEAFFKEPDRLDFTDPRHCNLSPVSKRFLADITDYFSPPNDVTLEASPVVDAGYGFIFGIGLGYHLKELIARTISRYLILIEPIGEFIGHSFQAIDWAELFEEAEKKGITIHFIIGMDPEAVNHEIERLIVQYGETFLDGSLAYLHYFSWPITEARKILNERLKTYYISRGFFEDEILMMTNTYGNLHRWPSRILARERYLEQDMPVFIVGSGPSFDKALPHIKKWRDRIIVFSCGTSLGLLLKNGIVPDLHVENENTPQLVNNLREFHTEYGFKGITLVASTTVNPEVSGLFDKKWFYFRSHLSSAFLLNNAVQPLIGAAPLVANGAFAAISTLGFKNIYLIGVDCGRHPDDGHHSKDAVYYQEDYDNYLEGESLELLETEFTRVVPGNFGGEVLTTWYLDMSRVSLSGLRRLSDVNLYNCGEGARIDGAQPKAVAAIELSYPPGRQGEVLAKVEEQMKAYEPDAFLDPIDISSLAEACDDFKESFSALLEQALAEDKGFWEFERRLDAFRKDKMFALKGVLTVIGGTYTSMVRLGAFGGNRIGDEKKRLEYLRFFIKRYGELSLWMADEIKVMLLEMAARKTTLSDVGKIDAA